MTYRQPFAEPLHLGVETWMLGLEAWSVIGLRMMRIAAGGASGDRETQLMWSEKFAAAIELQQAFFTGGLGTTPLSGALATVRHYRGKVRANRRRLS